MVQAKSDRPVISVLFVCEGNTCRSLLAQTLARRRFGSSVLASSAGLRPQSPSDAKSAIEALSDLGFNVSWHVPRDVRAVNLEAFDLVIAMDNIVASDLRELTDREITVWDFADPWNNPGAYKQCALEIDQKLTNQPLICGEGPG